MGKTLHKREVGARLRLAREALGLSQSEMAERYGLSDKSIVSNWERGVNYPEPWFIWQIFDKDGISADWLYLGKRWSLTASVEAKVSAAESSARAAVASEED